MALTPAALLALGLSFVACTLAAVWYAVPRLRRQPVAAGLTVLLWLHVGRHVALQIFSSQQHGLAISDRLRDQIAYGDLAGMVLALLAIAVLRYRPGAAAPIVALFALVTVADLANAGAEGVRESAFATATDVSWLILTFYVPILWLSAGLVVWLLATRHAELRSAPRGQVQG